MLVFPLSNDSHVNKTKGNLTSFAFRLRQEAAATTQEEEEEVLLGGGDQFDDDTAQRLTQVRKGKYRTKMSWHSSSLYSYEFVACGHIGSVCFFNFLFINRISVYLQQ